MLRSTFSGFTTARLAMRASQGSLDVVGQNIANLNTDGYTRQRLDVVSIHNSNSGPLAIGYGVEIKSISQVRDPFLDVQYRSQIAKVGYADSRQGSLDLLGNVFDETNRDAIKTGFSDLSSQLAKLSSSTNSGDQTFDSMVRASSQVLLDYFHQNAATLKSIRHETTTGFSEVDITKANTILSEIGKLNDTIKTNEIMENSCLELKDKRNILLDELASYLPIEVKYSDQKLSAIDKVEVLDVTFRDKDGVTHSLISDSKVGEFSVDISKSPVSLFVKDAKTDTVSDNLSDKLLGGTFKGTLDMLNKSGPIDGTDTKGFGYYEKTLDSLAKTFAETFNELNKGFDSTIDIPLFDTSDGQPFTATNIKITDKWLDGSIKITTSKKEKPGSTDNDNILSMISALTAKRPFKTAEIGADGNPTGNEIALYNGGFEEYYSNVEVQMGIESKSNTSLLKNNLTIIKQISNTKDSVSGVSLDEEGMDLMHYQQSYSAAARLMTTLDEALDTLINRTGVVGR